MSDKITLKAQATAVERAYVNLRGHRDNLARLVSAGKRPEHELKIVDGFLLDLAPAVRTMKFLLLNEDTFRAMIESRP